ncbi:hypothetical protein TRVL_05006 [Trypanosoma vivax]|nr:hypothetical protein TRVL_05006 [Trypanosoma vivax]
MVPVLLASQERLADGALPGVLVPVTQPRAPFSVSAVPGCPSCVCLVRPKQLSGALPYFAPRVAPTCVQTKGLSTTHIAWGAALSSPVLLFFVRACDSPATRGSRRSVLQIRSSRASAGAVLLLCFTAARGSTSSATPDHVSHLRSAHDSDAPRRENV